MIHKYLKNQLFFVIISVVFFVRNSEANSALSDENWDIQEDELTKEIDQLTERPEVYARTPAGLDPYTIITDPPEYYENEYADKPCQDRAQGKIMTKKNDSKVKKNAMKTSDQLIQMKKEDPKVVVDTLKVSKVNGVYKVQQNIVTDNLTGDVSLNEKDIGKKAVIGDNVNEDKEEEVKENDVDQQIPIGDNVKKTNDEENTENIVAKNEPQANMEDVLKKVKEEVLDENKKDPSDKISAIVNDLKHVPNVKSLYNVMDMKDTNKQDKLDETHQVKANHEKHVAFVGKLVDDLNGGAQNKGQDAAESRKVQSNNPSNDIQIKIKLESVDDAKRNLNNQMNSLMEMARKPLSGMEQLQSMMNKIMPMNLNGLSRQNPLDSKVAQPQNFYMKYLQIDPDQHKLRYEYYFFQKYVNSRYNAGKPASQASNGNPLDVKSLGQPSSSVLMSKLLGQMLGPMSSMSLLNPIMSLLNPQVYYRPPQQSKNLPVRIFINEKSAAKYKRSLDAMEKVRSKRDVTETEMPLFNEGPLKVEDKAHLNWAKDFLKEWPKEERPSSYKIIHHQPPSTDVLQWYHPFPGENATYYTIEPTVTRTLGPGEPADLCDCHHKH